jgi:hypothetical protein
MTRKNNPETKSRDLTHRRRCERTGKFWRDGCANPRENAIRMRKDYLKQTARLIYIHGFNCFGKHNLVIGREP